MVHTVAEIRGSHVRTEMTDSEKQLRQPGIGQRLGLWKEGEDHQDANRDQQRALQKSENAAGEPVKATQSQAVHRL